MNIRTLTLVLGSALTVAAGGIGATACSSSSSGGNGGSSSGGSHNDGGSDGTASSSGSSSGSTSSSGSSSGSASSSGGTSSSGGGDAGTCKSPELHPPVDGGGLYCPFSFNDAIDSGIQYCTQPGQMCCVSPATDAGISDCENVGANCTTTGFTPWQCSAPSDCTNFNVPVTTVDGGASSGPVVCCITAGAVKADTSSGICAGVEKTEGNAGNLCMYQADCQGTVIDGTFTDTRYVACESNADCASITGATTCTAVYTIGTSIGICTP
jgi:hypothetical protein